MASPAKGVPGSSPVSTWPPSSSSQTDRIRQVAASARSAPDLRAVSFELPTYDFNARLFAAYQLLNDFRMENARDLLGEIHGMASSLELTGKEAYVIPSCLVGLARSYPEESEERVDWAHRALETIQKILEQQFSWNSSSEKQNTYRSLVVCLSVLQRKLISLDNDQSQRKIIELILKCRDALNTPASMQKVEEPPETESPRLGEAAVHSLHSATEKSPDKSPSSREGTPPVTSLQQTVEPVAEEDSYRMRGLFALCVVGAIVVGALAWRHIIQINPSQR